jgi:hypothetical protein
MVEKYSQKTDILTPKSETEKLLKLTGTSEEINLNIYNWTEYDFLFTFIYTFDEHNTWIEIKFNRKICYFNTRGIKFVTKTLKNS